MAKADGKENADPNVPVALALPPPNVLMTRARAPKPRQSRPPQLVIATNAVWPAAMPR